MVNTLLPVERIEQRIFRLRDQNVMPDADLAELYGVETKALNRAVKRNKGRFPVFQLLPPEVEALRCQSGTSTLRSQFGTSKGHGGRRYLPYAFTEQGVAMLSGVLRSKRAVQVNIEIMRTFVRLRRILSEHKDLARKLDALERKYDAQLKVVFNAIRKLMEPPPAARKRIGFGVTGDR
jgi:ORF6N domain